MTIPISHIVLIASPSLLLLVFTLHAPSLLPTRFLGSSAHHGTYPLPPTMRRSRTLSPPLSKRNAETSSSAATIQTLRGKWSGKEHVAIVSCLVITSLLISDVSPFLAFVSCFCFFRLLQWFLTWSDLHPDGPHEGECHIMIQFPLLHPFHCSQLLLSSLPLSAVSAFSFS